MTGLTVGSLFFGAGGLDLAVEAATGAHTVWHSEVNPAASTVLAHRWPSVPNLGDITAVDWRDPEPVDILCGGFPCQDVSAAGRRAGMGEGTRSGLWSQFHHAIDTLTPPLVVIENVRGLLSVDAGEGRQGIDVVLDDLVKIGYSARWAVVSACSVGAPHRRDRVFILARPAAPLCMPEVERIDVPTGIDRLLLLLPTPQARAGKGSNPNRNGGDDLPTARRKLLPTPGTADAVRGPDYARAGREGSGGDDLITICCRAFRNRARSRAMPP